MFLPGLAHILLWIIVAISIVLMLVRPRGIAEVWWISGGAVLLVALRLIPVSLAGRAIAKGTDVYLFLIGMMLLSEVAREMGVFDWLATIAVHSARGSCSRLFTLIYVAGTAVTVFMSNDATAVVLTPAVLAAVRRAKVAPLPYLYVCALIANAASFMLPISNPANLVVFHDGMPPLGRWFVSFGVPSVLSIATTYFVMRWIFRKELLPAIGVEIIAARLTSHGKLVLAGLGATGAVLLTASALQKDLGLPTCLLALAVTTVVSAASRRNPLRFAGEISWSTLALVAGLFIMVDAVESNSALPYTLRALAWVDALPLADGAFASGFAVGIATNLVNNLPLGLIAGATLHVAQAKVLIVDSVMIGVDLGPNLSITGSLATILWLLALKREKLEVGFWQFLRVGSVAMPLAMASALGGSLLIHALSAGH
jgi:arsenical pump membrane protein